MLGALADRKGRKSATILTLFLMALGTGIIGLAPTYAEIGLAGPLLVVAGRLIQGFSTGGEVGASTTLLAEYAPPEERGFYGSWQLASQGAAILFATAIAWTLEMTLAAEAVRAWGWRIPFLIGIFLLPVGLWLRQTLKETHANESSARTRDVNSLAKVLRRHGREIVVGIALVIGATASNAVIVLYLSTYAIRHLGMAPASALFAGVAAGLVTLAVAPPQAPCPTASAASRSSPFPTP